MVCDRYWLWLMTKSRHADSIHSLSPLVQQIKGSEQMLKEVNRAKKIRCPSLRHHRNPTIEISLALDAIVFFFCFWQLLRIRHLSLWTPSHQSWVIQQRRYQTPITLGHVWTLGFWRKLPRRTMFNELTIESSDSVRLDILQNHWSKIYRPLLGRSYPVFVHCADEVPITWTNDFFLHIPDLGHLLLTSQTSILCLFWIRTNSSIKWRFSYQGSLYGYRLNSPFLLGYIYPFVRNSITSCTFQPRAGSLNMWIHL